MLQPTILFLIATILVVIVTGDFRWLIFPAMLFLFYSFQTKEITAIVVPDKLEPTLNDPFMNNIDSDVLKVLPKETKELTQKQEQFLHWNHFKDADDIFDRSEDRTYYTTPPDDQEAFISFLNYDLKEPLDVQFDDLKKDHYLFPNKN